MTRSVTLSREDDEGSRPTRSFASLRMTEEIMGRRVTSLSRMPNADCRACHGLGSIHMTVHFYSGDTDWEAPCWECFGTDVKLTFPHPKTTDN